MEPTMPSPPSRPITEDEIRTYQDDGIVCLRGMFDADTVAMLREAADHDMDQPGPMAHDVTRDGTGRFFADTFVWQHNDALRGFVFDSPAADMAAALLRSRKINLLFDQFLIKMPGTSTPTLWHHDEPYWPVAGTQICTLWIALDEVTRATGAVEYVCSSHRWGKRFKAVSFRDPGLYKEDLPPVPDIEALRAELKLVQFEMQPGDCTVHHGRTLHGAPGNSSTTQKRRAYIVRWMGDDVSYNPRPNLQPMLRDPGIAPGAALDCELFPRVRPLPAAR
jgi:ectoine hydroxylase-related dioxygenase (phytanoyl-CoA dioxygenase family)